MVKKTLITLIIIATLITASIIEINSTKNFIKNYTISTNKISKEFNTNKNNITVLLPLLNKEYNTWNNNKKYLNLSFSYRDLNNISECYSRLIAFSKCNDYNNALSEISLLNYYKLYFNEFMSVNFSNLL